MNEFLEVKLRKSTIELLKSCVNDFEMTVDDVVLNVIEENRSLKLIIGQDRTSAEDLDVYRFKDYVIHKLPKGKIRVTKAGVKVTNMKKILVEAGLAVGMDETHLNQELTTYEIGRFLFKHLQSDRCRSSTF